MINRTSTIPYFNDANAAFYDAMAIEKLADFAQIVGLANCEDVAVIYEDLATAESIAELGAGYGRVVDYLLNNGYSGNILAVERIGQFVEYLLHQYHEQVTVVEEDIKKLQLPNSVDRMLWLWSGILELSPEELKMTLQNLRTQLNPGGILYLEVPFEIRFIGEHQPDEVNIIHYETEWGSIRAYLPTHEELTTILMEAGFARIETFDYLTAREVSRIFYKAFVD
jgi:SAM-dependent methyltransferase